MTEENKRLAPRPFPVKSVNFAELVNSGKNMGIITWEQARDAGSKTYWSGMPCNKGHYSVRNTAGRVCAACVYLHNEHAKQEKKKKREAKQAAREAGEVFINNKHKNQALTVYAKTGDIEDAARSINLTLDQFNVETAKDLNFFNAVENVEKRLRARGIKVQSKLGVPSDKDYEFQWDDEKRRKLIRVFIDTGDIASARDSVRATPSLYYEELDRNIEFRRAVDKATPRANQAIEERGIQEALRGNDKLITLILKAKKPEYQDKVKVEQNVSVTHQLSDSQLAQRIAYLSTKHNVGLIIDNDADSDGAGGATQLPGRTGTS